MKYHLLVLVHGLWGNPSHFDYISQQIEQKHFDSDEERLVVYRTEGNEGYKTLDGIDVCGLRVANEIKEQIDLLNQEGKVTKFSIVGYSLGGLISRFVIGVLFFQGVFQSIKPVNFTTFCTPHVGVLTPGSNISVKLFNSLIPSLLSMSGKQMFLKDLSLSNGIALLSLMANKSSIFYKALAAFKYRSLYANAINDKRTSWFTSGISMVDPFLKIDETSSVKDLNYNFVKGYEPIVIDANKKFDISNKPIISTKPIKTIESNFWKRKWNWVVVVLNLIFFAPLWVVWFILAGILQTYKSKRRISVELNVNSSILSTLSSLGLVEQKCDCSSENDLTAKNSCVKSLEKLEIVENDLDDIAFDNPLSSVPSIVSITESFKSLSGIDGQTELQIQQSLQDRADTLMESVWDAMTSIDAIESAKLAEVDFISNHGAVPDDENICPSTNQTQSNDLKPSISKNEIITVSINELSYLEKNSPELRNDVLKKFTLNVSKDQLTIIKNLNELKWEKFPILIRKTKSTHSAAIVRNIDEVGLYEGKTVVKHWLDEIFHFD